MKILNFDISQVGIILTSHPKHQMFMDQGIKSYMGWRGGPIVLSYDSITSDKLPLDLWTPPITHVICSGKKPGELGHVKGELFLMMISGKKLEELGAKYVYKSAADTTCFRHYKFEDLINELNDNNVNFIRSGTAAIFGKIKDFNKVLQNVENDLNKTIGGAELYWGKYERYNEFTKRGGRNYFDNILGRIHIQGEYAFNTRQTVRDTWSIGEVWK
jgi:hypothetical protein